MSYFSIIPDSLNTQKSIDVHPENSDTIERVHFQINPLTSLRGLAAFFIFCLHTSESPLIINFFILNARVAVNVFFVLYGFLLPLSYSNCSFDDPKCKKTFWLTQIARILPTYWINLILAIFLLVIDWNILYVPSIILNIFLLQSWFPCWNYTWYTVSWSISVEAMFYLFFPYIFVRIEKFRLKSEECNKSYRFWYIFPLAIIIISFTPIIILYLFFDTDFVEQKGFCLIYYNSIPRFPDFITGIWCYNLYAYKLYPNRFKIKWYMIDGCIILVVLFTLVTPLNTEIPYIIGSSGYSIFSSLIILSLSINKGIFCYMLNCNILIAAGNMSLTFYLLHTTVQTYLKYNNIPLSLLFPVQFCVTMFLASIIHFFIEKPLYKTIVDKANSQGYKCNCV